MAEPGQGRYARQSHAFPVDRRQSSAVALLGAESNPFAGAAVLAGAAAMGLPVVGSDFHGPCREGGHWLLGDYPEMIARLNPRAEYEYLDPGLPAADVPYVLAGHANAWIVVLLNRPARAHDALLALSEAGLSTPVLLVVVGPGGLVVERHPDPRSAFDAALSMPAKGVDEGPTELAIAAAGLVLNEVMLAGGQEGDASPRTVGFYSLHRRRRVRFDGGPTGDLFGEVASGPGGAASFASRRLVMVGAGALGNWSAIPLAMEGPAEVVIYDGDPEVAATNLNRQVLLIGGVGQARPKVDVLVQELRALDPAGSYRGVASFVRQPGDLGDVASADALLSVPDNDEARLVCDDARRQAGVLFGTAGSSAVGGQAIVRCPWHCCLRCLGLNGNAAAEAEAQSCSLVHSDAVVSSNMLAAGLMISELRQALAGREPANIRFAGDSPSGNRLVRMISGASCPHVAAKATVG